MKKGGVDDGDEDDKARAGVRRSASAKAKWRKNGIKGLKEKREGNVKEEGNAMSHP